MRLSPAFAALALAIAARPVAADDCLREMSEQTFETAGWHAIEVANPRGQVMVRPSADGRCHLSALKVVCARVSRRAELSREIRVETRTEGGRFRIEVFYPHRTDIRIGFWDLFSDFTFPRAEVRLTVEVPPALPLAVRSSSGDLATEGLLGPQVLESASGDVRVRDARGGLEVNTSSGDVDAAGIGPARIRSSSGDVTVDRARGPLVVRSTSGDLTIRGAQDSIAVTSASGDVKIDRAPRGLSVSTSSGVVEVGTASGGVRLSSASGDLSVDLAPPFRGAELGSSSGDMKVWLRGAMDCDLDLESSSGTLSVSVPVELGDVTRHSIRGRIGHGQVPLRARSASGDIEIAEGGGR